MSGSLFVAPAPKESMATVPERSALPLRALLLLLLTSLLFAPGFSLAAQSSHAPHPVAAAGAKNGGSISEQSPQPAAEAAASIIRGQIVCSPDKNETALHLPGYEAVCIDPDIPEVQRLGLYWKDIEAHHNPEKSFGRNTGMMNPATRLQWQNLSKLMPTWTQDKKLQYINGFFNNWTSINDKNNYGVEEYWASPEEFLSRNGGDCEDFAIIKYYALRYFSWPTQNMWILLVNDKKTDEKHAVLAVKTSDKRLFILCNLSRPAYLLIPADRYMQNFTPLFALNEHGLWMLVEKGADAGSKTATDEAPGPPTPSAKKR